MSPGRAVLAPVMEQAIEACIAHVDSGGLPFVGVVVGASGQVISQFGVNQVRETGDPTAHAEIVAMRDAMARRDLLTLSGAVLLATGEPCGLCYRHAIEHGIEQIHVAVDRDEVAAFGFDYLSSYPAFGITDAHCDDLFRPLPVTRAVEPFTHYLRHSTGRAAARLGTPWKGTPS